jgi:DNA-binding response OmpR family regulator
MSANSLVGIVIVVDDDADLREAVAMTLQAEDYLVWQASDGVVALMLLSCVPMDGWCIVVTDLHMPNLDGRQLALQIRQVRGTRARVLLMSSDLMGASADGTDAFLQKPFRADELRAAVAKLRHSLDAPAPRPRTV